MVVQGLGLCDSIAGGTGSIPGLRAKIPASCAQDQKEKNRKGLKLSSSVQSLSHVWLFVNPWTTAHQASLCITNSQFTQIHVHWVGDAIQSSHSLLSPSPPAFNLSQHQGLFQWANLPKPTLIRNNCLSFCVISLLFIWIETSLWRILVDYFTVIWIITIIKIYSRFLCVCL